MKKNNIFGGSRLLLLLAILAFLPSPGLAETRTFARFEAELPEGWDGDEQTGFLSDDGKEYNLAISKKDEAAEKILSHVGIYLLPNRPGLDARESALKLAESQGEPSEPAREGLFWKFTGEPRSSAVKGRAETWVNADKDNLLVIMVVNPEEPGAKEVFASLKGLDKESRALLGR